jgi:AcrR family transcriptional regulator
MLIDAAVELCIRQGYERTTVEQIAAVADVSPRTFSRYFVTKDAVVLAIVYELVEMVSAELPRQPPGISDFEALCRAHVQVFMATKKAPADGLTAERLLASVRIVNSSPSLKAAVADLRLKSLNSALAERMGVACDQPRVQLVAGVWAAIIITALAAFTPDTDWESVTVEDMASRLQATHSLFIDLTAGIRQPV